MSVEHLSRKLGKRHSLVLYHLETLQDLGVVKVVIEKKHGTSSRRSIWGLNIENPNLVKLVKEYVFSTYSREKLGEMTSRNQKVR